MHTVFALLCFVVVIHWLIFPYPSGLLHWHCGNLTIAPVPAKQPWWIWINTSCEFIMNDCITTTKQSTTKPCAYTVWINNTQSNSLGPCVACRTVCRFFMGPSACTCFLHEGLIKSLLHGSSGSLKNLLNVINWPYRTHDTFQWLAQLKIA